MSFADLFIKKDETPAAPQAPAQNFQPAPATVTVPAGTPITCDDTIIDRLWKMIVDSNRPGPDYLELKNNVDALSDLPISDDQKIVSAFKVLKKSYPNFQKDDIIKAIDFYVNVVNNEKSVGLSELEGIKANTVTAVEDEIKKMQEQAEGLKKQYDVLQAKIASRSVELTKARADIEQKNQVFLGSVKAVIDVLEGDKNNIMNINF